MKEATFSAEDLGLDGRIEAVQFDNDNTVTVKYTDEWGRLISKLEEHGEIVNHEEEFNFVDFDKNEYVKFSTAEVYGWKINAVAIYADDEDREYRDYMRVWFRKA